MSFARLIAFAISIVAVVGLYLFLTRTFIGTAIRAVSQDREAMALMGANPQRIYIVTSAVGGAMAGLAGALLIFQYSVHPFFGGQFGPLTFMICVLGGLGNMVGAFVASFIMSEIISIGRRDLVHRDGLRHRLRGLHRDDLRPARRHPGPSRLSAVRAPRPLGVILVIVLALVPALPMGGMKQYVLHVMIQIFIWSFIGGAWSLMGRFGLVSLGHGAFLGLGAYTTVLLWNFFGITPWLGGVVAMILTALLAAVVAYPCSRFQVVGHYFGLVTLAVGEVIRLLIIAERDWTGGSLGVSIKPAGGDSLLAMQFADKRVFYYAALVLWLAGLWVWARVDRSMARSAMEAIGEDETAAASVGIHVTRFKLGITVLSAALTAVGGVAYAQYISYVNPDTLSGIGVSLRIVFAVVLGGMYSLLGPTVGTALTIALSEYLRIAFGLQAHRHGRDDLRAAARDLHHLSAVGHLRQPGRAGAPSAPGAGRGCRRRLRRRAWARSASIPSRSRRRRPAR